MRLILLRHGPAGSRDPARWPNDGQRPLSPSGEERTQVAMQGLARLLGEPPLVLTSPLTRARQTARLLAEAFPNRVLTENLEALSPGGSLREVLARVANANQEVVVLVGHEPDLGSLAGRLVVGTSVSLPLKKAGACAIDIDGTPRPGSGGLVWFLAPKVLRRMAKKSPKKEPKA